MRHTQYPILHVLRDLCTLVTLGHIFVVSLTDMFHYFCRAVDISPDIGSSKYLYLGQLCDSQEAINYLSKGIKLLTEEGKSIDTTLETSSAYCSMAEIYLTDEW